MQEFGLYIHFPYCTHKCFYCDFYSLENFSTYKPFINALKKEIELRTKDIHEKIKISSVFIGGGTPSLINTSDLSEIIEYVRKRFEIDEYTEMTIECNPGSALKEKLIDFRAIGFNRLSLGVQTFVESELKFLERIHNANEANTAIEFARNAGFDNVSLDIIFSIPGQTIESLKYSMERALSLGTDHLSAYSLIYEPGTPLEKAHRAGKISKVDEELDAENYQFVMEFMRSAGFEQYEVSNYAKNGKYCRHNLDIWHGGEYFAFGPSAHGLIFGSRYNNFRSINKYIEYLNTDLLPTENIEILDTKTKLEEMLYLGLRSDGIDIDKINRIFQIDLLNMIADKTARLERSGMISLDSKIRLSASGYQLCDEIYLNIFHNIIK